MPVVPSDHGFVNVYTKSPWASFVQTLQRHGASHRVPNQAFQLGRVDELFDDNPHGDEMNQSQKGLAQFLIPRGNASKLLEVVAEPFSLLT